jgi:hypothetical protein
MGFFERRQSPRVEPDPFHPVEVQIMGSGFLEIVEAADLGVGGVGFYLPHGVDGSLLNTPVEIIITLPRARSIHLRGVLCHLDPNSDPCRLGVRFARLPPNAAALIQRYVDLNAHRPYAPPASSSG